MWNELAPVADRNGCLTEMDVELFAHACVLLAVVRKTPKDSLKELAQADRILARFGFTPSDRAKISVKPKNDDPFDKFLGKRAK